MKLFNPGTGTRMSVPDRLVGRYLSKGWVQAGGAATPSFPDASVAGAGGSAPAGGEGPPLGPDLSGVVTLSGAQVPDGTAKDVIDWVGDDRARARSALAAEQAKGDDARTTLVAKLTKLAEQ